MKSILMIIFGITVLFAAITQAEKKEPMSGFIRLSFVEVRNCEGRPDFITEVRPEIIGGFKKLPRIVLIAKEAEYYVESKTSESNLKIHSYQSFTTMDPKEKSKIICGNAKSTENLRFSLFAPTLVDTTNTMKIGQSLWQFQILSSKDGFSVWNKRSLALAEGENLEKALIPFGGNYRIYQLSSDQYEVVVSKDTEGVAQYLSIKYDAVKSQ